MCNYYHYDSRTLLFAIAFNITLRIVQSLHGTENVRETKHVNSRRCHKTSISLTKNVSKLGK